MTNNLLKNCTQIIDLLDNSIKIHKKHELQRYQQVKELYFKIKDFKNQEHLLSKLENDI